MIELHFYYKNLYILPSEFARENTDAVLLVDASNAFNQVNRQSALHNISILCPSFATILQNTYGVPIRLFITGEGEIASTEGTTQGDTLACSGCYPPNTFPSSVSARCFTGVVC